MAIVVLALAALFYFSGPSYTVTHQNTSDNFLSFLLSLDVVRQSKPTKKWLQCAKSSRHTPTPRRGGRAGSGAAEPPHYPSDSLSFLDVLANRYAINWLLNLFVIIRDH